MKKSEKSNSNSKMHRAGPAPDAQPTGPAGGPREPAAAGAAAAIIVKTLPRPLADSLRALEEHAIRRKQQLFELACAIGREDEGFRSAIEAAAHTVGIRDVQTTGRWSLDLTSGTFTRTAPPEGPAVPPGLGSTPGPS